MVYDKVSRRRYDIIKRDKFPFSCPKCGTHVLSSNYENHCKIHCAKNPKLDPLVCCVWCLGKYTFEKGTKNKHSDHILECYMNFKSGIFYPVLKEKVISNLSRSNTRASFDLAPMCDKKQFFDSEPILSERCYEPVWPIELEPLAITFANDSLNLAASCVRKYLEKDDGALWFHTTVRAFVFEQFLDSVDSYRGEIKTLPFSCWCDGGTESETRHRQHRHMIVVFPNAKLYDGFKKRFKPKNKPHPKFKCWKNNPIESALHLVNVLGYVSRRNSECKRTVRNGVEICSDANHFCILETLPKDYALVCVTQWDGGIMEWIHQRYNNTDPRKLLRVPAKFVDGKWRIRVKNLPDIQFDLAFPVSKSFRPSREPTDLFLCLTDGKKLYFQRSENKKMERYVFCRVVGDEWWTPRYLQQSCLNCAKPVMEQRDRLKNENDDLKRKNRDLETRLEFLKKQKLTSSSP